MSQRVLVSVFMLAFIASASLADDKAEPRKGDSYVKVEARGKLQTGIMAIGGETTGIQIRTDAGAFELEIDAKQQGEAKKLAGKTVIVTGSLIIKPGVTRGPRTIIKVATIKEAR
jgi:hypothetical protein